MWEKFRKYVDQICSVLEGIAALLVLAGVILAMVSLIRNVELFQGILNETDTFHYYLEQVFVIVIGIEFLQMLCRPDSDNVIEILIFLVARHMIIGETSPYQDFVSVISVALLCIIRRYLHNMKEGVTLRMMLESRNGRKVSERIAEEKKQKEES